MNGDHDGRIKKLEEKVSAMHESIRENTVITLATKADTKELVALYKGGSLLGKIFLWLVLAGAAITTILTFVKAKV